VHLGNPTDASARNIVVDFPYYIKNVASSEIYPTWPEDSLRANIYAIISYTLNRYYTEWYRSQGFDFDITSVIQFDQKFIENRELFEPIIIIVDEIFNNFLRKRGQMQPFFAAYCDGRRTMCDGLHQWGTVDLANRGYTYLEILKHYYGEDIYIVFDAPVLPNMHSFPGEDLELGMAGNSIARIQRQINRIAQNYPALPRVIPPNGVFGESTRLAVQKFQEIFNVPQTGVINKATWYRVNYMYIAVKKLLNLRAEAITPEEAARPFPEELSPGMSGAYVSHVQYFLAVIAAFYNSVVPPDMTGVYDEKTVESVMSFQKIYGLPETGNVDRETWNAIQRAYAGIIEVAPFMAERSNVRLFPGQLLTEGMTSDSIRILQEMLSLINQTYPNVPAVSATGFFGPITKNAVIAVQTMEDLEPNGIVDAITWDAIATMYAELL